MAYFKKTLKNVLSERSDLLEAILLPTQLQTVEQNSFRDLLAARYKQFEVVEEDPELLWDWIRSWSVTNLQRWQKLFNVIYADYDPTENYKRDVEIHGDTLNRGTAHTEGDAAQNVFAYNNNSADGVPRTKNTSESDGRNRAVGKYNETSLSHGNSGFQTVQKGLLEEIQIHQQRLLGVIMQEFVSEFLVAIW